MFWANGGFYKGEWKQGLQNGKGQIYQNGGDVISGIFLKGSLVQVMPSFY